MKPYLCFVCLSFSLLGCADWPAQSAALDAQAAGVQAPSLLPQDQGLAVTGSAAQAAGDALAAQAAALRLRASGL